jgi:3-hydroxyacyl-[acyl-carrier-protein] dehydratase
MNYFKMIDKYEQKDQYNLYSFRGLTMTEEVFTCHFPAFPVLPGVLMLEMCRQTIDKYFTEKRVADYKLISFSKVKFQSFARPGDVLETEITLKKEEANMLHFSAKISNVEKNIASVKSIVYKIF